MANFSDIPAALLTDAHVGDPYIENSHFHTFGTAFRQHPWPTQAFDNHTGSSIDITVAGFIATWVSVYCVWLFVVPSRWRHSNNSFLGQLTLELVLMFMFFTGLIIQLGLWGERWRTGSVNGTNLPYVPGTDQTINATVGLHVHLRGINVTLHADEASMKATGQIIGFNEFFSWEWQQGRNGFGVFAGKINREYRFAQMQGKPLPILNIADYFIFDGDGLRWARYYRLAGYYAYVMLWTAFGVWVIMGLALLLRIPLQDHGGGLLMLSGVLQACAIIIYSKMYYKPLHLMIPISDTPDGKEKVVLTTHYGWCWAMVLTNAIMAVLVGAFVTVCDPLGLDSDVWLMKAGRKQTAPVVVSKDAAPGKGKADASADADMVAQRKKKKKKDKAEKRVRVGDLEKENNGGSAPALRQQSGLGKLMSSISKKVRFGGGATRDPTLLGDHEAGSSTAAKYMEDEPESHDEQPDTPIMGSSGDKTVDEALVSLARKASTVGGGNNRGNGQHEDDDEDQERGTGAAMQPQSSGPLGGESNPFATRDYP